MLLPADVAVMVLGPTTEAGTSPLCHGALSPSTLLPVPGAVTNYALASPLPSFPPTGFAGGPPAGTGLLPVFHHKAPSMARTIDDMCLGGYRTAAFARLSCCALPEATAESSCTLAGFWALLGTAVESVCIVAGSW